MKTRGADSGCAAANLATSVAATISSPCAADGRRSRRQVQRQNFVPRDVGEIEHVDQMHVGVDQTGQGKLPSPIDPHRIPRHIDRCTCRGDRDDQLTADENGPVLKHLG